MSLPNRRAIYVYESSRLHAEAMGGQRVPAPWDERTPAFRQDFREKVALYATEDYHYQADRIHNDWMADQIADGWTYGPVYDEIAKTDPDLVPWEEQPWRKRIRDIAFAGLCDLAQDTIVDNEEDTDVLDRWEDEYG